MSNLPHPLGTANPGDMFYPGSPTVIAQDLAGSGGSRAVEFGEDVISSAQNRSAYALAKNCEYIQSRMESLISKPTVTSFTPAGGNGGAYTFTGVQLFVGDATYIPETAEIIRSLVRVVDANMDAVVDASGNLVVVKDIRNSGDTASIVGDTGGAGGDGNGFYSGAIVHFQTVNPVTKTVVSASYTLPDSVEVRLIHGVGRTLDSLATSGQQQLMRDMLMMVNRMSLSMGAEVFTTAGSRKMLGDIDVNLNDILNPLVVQGATANDLTLRSLVDLKFTDVRSTDIKFSEANEATLSTSLKSSILGAINSSTRLNKAVLGNRVTNLGGALVWTGATGQITFPAGMRVSLNGEDIAVSGTLSTTSGAIRAAVVNSSGTIVERNLSAVVSTDVVLAYYQWNGSTTFTTALDARWLANKRTGELKVTLGDAPGADFTDLSAALAVIQSLKGIRDSAGVAPLRAKIRISGNLTIASTVTFPAVELMFEGDGPTHSSITAGSGFVTTTDLFTHSASVACSFSGIKFVWSSSSVQNAANCCFKNLGPGSSITRCVFDGTTTGFANIALWSSAASGIDFLYSKFNKFDGYVVNVNGYASNVRVSFCEITDGSSGTAFNIRTNGNSITNCIIGASGAPQDIAAVIGESCSVVGCLIYATTNGIVFTPDTGVFTSGVYSASIKDNIITGPGSTGEGVKIAQSASGVGYLTVEGNKIVSWGKAVYLANTGSPSVDSHFFIKDNYITLCNRGVETSGTVNRNVIIHDNRFYMKDVVTNAESVYLVGTVAYAEIVGNIFASKKTVNQVNSFIYAIDSTVSLKKVTGNYFYGGGALLSSYGATRLQNQTSVEFCNNRFADTLSFETAFYFYDCDYMIIKGNHVSGVQSDAISFNNSTGVSKGNIISGNVLSSRSLSGATSIYAEKLEQSVISGNYLTGGAGIHVTNGRHVVVIGNVLDSCLGNGVHFDGSDGKYASVINNVLSTVGDSGGDGYGVRTNWEASKVSGNIITALVNGSASPQVGIFLDATTLGALRSVIVGNIIQLVDSFETANFVCGIYANATGCLVSENNILLDGIAATDADVFGISTSNTSSSHNSLLSTNVVDVNATVSGTGVSNAINVEDNGCVVNGNLCVTDDIYISGSGGMCLGNVTASGSTTPDSYATSGNT